MSKTKPNKLSKPNSTGGNMKLAKRIIRLLRGGVVVEVKYLESGIWGYCLKDQNLVQVSKRLCVRSRVRTLVHEMLHFIFPENTEKQTLRLEDEVFCSLSPIEYKQLTRYIK